MICILFQLAFNIVSKPQLGWGLLPSDLYRVPYLRFRFICRSKGRDICDFGLKGARRANRCILWPKPRRLQNMVIYSHLQDHCSPSQAVTSKIYHLKQRFLPTATTWRFTKIKYHKIPKISPSMYNPPKPVTKKKPSESRAMFLTPLPLPPYPQESVPLAHIFASLAMNGPLPAGLKFRENTARQCL